MTNYNIGANLAGAGGIPVGVGVSTSGLQIWYKFEDVISTSANLLLHLDSNFADATGRHVPTQTNVSISSAHSVAGGASALFSSAGVGSYINVADNLSDFTFTGDFTIDLWFYPTSFVSGCNLFNIGNDTLHLYAQPGTNILAIYSLGSPITGTTALALNTWYRVTLSRAGSTIRLYLNGVQEGGDWTTTQTFTPTTQIFIGENWFGGQATDGYIDEFTVTKSSSLPSFAVSDSSINNNTGTFTGAPMPTSGGGRFGQAVMFNAGSSRVNVPGVAVSIPSPTSSFSIMGWVQTTLQSAVIFGGRNVTIGNAIINLTTDFNGYDNSYSGAGSILLRDNAGSGLVSCNGTTPLNDGLWHHVCAVFDGSPGINNQTLRMYVDGALQSGPTSAPLQAGITLDNVGANIGYEYLNGFGTTGGVDDFRFYSRALSATEVASVYSGVTVLTGLAVAQMMAGQSKLAGAGTASVAPRQQLASRANWAGGGGAVNKASLNLSAKASWAGLGNLPSVAAQKAGLLLGVNFAGVGGLIAPLRQQMAVSAGLVGGGVAGANTKAIFAPLTVLAGAGGGLLKLSHVQNMAAELDGGGGINLEIPPNQHYAQAAWTGAGTLTVWLDWIGSDNINPGILEDAGEQLLYRNAAGLEKALATIDAYRLTVTYAELVRDQWDPWAISYRNLGYLAWAMGVNLWEDDWDEQFRRWWVANQWTFKYYRGSDLGLKMAVEAVNGKIVRLTRPPALFYPGAALTAAERQAYVARFPQLRLYPYAPRPQLPYLNYVGGITNKLGKTYYAKNGRFLGPLLKFYPTNYNAGGQYLRACTVYEPRTGVETPCTVRRVYGVLAGHQKPVYYDEVTLPARRDNHFYPGDGNQKYLLPKTYSAGRTRRHAVVLGAIDATPDRLIRVPRDGSLDITQFQAIFQTIVPSMNPLQVRPEHVYVVHPWHKYQFYCNRTIGPKRFLVKSDAWMYLYERWYLFDPTRLPDYRRANTYMGRSRFGIRKYSAEAKIAAFFHWPRRYSYYGGFMGPGRFFAPQNTKRIEQLRRAVVASMAARDTIAINTRVKRQIQLRDVTVLDGRFSVGQWITDSS